MEDIRDQALNYFKEHEHRSKGVSGRMSRQNFSMHKTQLIELINHLVKQTNENEWLEFKHNFHSE